MKRSILCLAGASLVVGCGVSNLEPIRQDPNQIVASGGGGAGGGESSGGGGTGGEVGGSTALAIRFGDLPPQVADYLRAAGEQIAGTGLLGWRADPDATVVWLATFPQACGGKPYAPSTLDPTCGEHGPFSQAAFVIPPDLFREGPIDLSDQRILLYEGWGQSDAGMYCSQLHEGWVLGGGVLTVGDLSGETFKVSFKQHGYEGSFAEDHSVHALFGDHEVTRCSATPTAAATSGVAIWGADLPPGAIDGTVDADSIYLFAGDAAESCGDPASSVDGTLTGRMMLSIPHDKLVPGVIKLADLGATWTKNYPYDPDEPGRTWSAPIDHGTIEILDVSAGSLSYKIYGSMSWDPDFVRYYDADGLYAVGVCP